MPVHHFDVIYIDDDPMMTELFNQFTRWKYGDWRSYAITDPLMLYNQIRAGDITARVWIVDIMMPGKNGTEVAAAIRERYGAGANIVGYTALEPQTLKTDPEYSGGLDNFSCIILKNEGIAHLLGLADGLVRNTPA